jgi:hypothetical protein
VSGVKIQARRDTAANWTSADPVLASGEFGYETDTGGVKIGNVTSEWSQITSGAAASTLRAGTMMMLRRIS